MTTNPEPLPGLEPPKPSASALEMAVHRTIRALEERDYLTEMSAARCALALELASIISDKRRSGRTSTVGNDARVLVELLDDLLPDDTEGDDDLKAAMAEWSEAIRAGFGGSTP